MPVLNSCRLLRFKRAVCDLRDLCTFKRAIGQCDMRQLNSQVISPGRFLGRIYIWEKILVRGNMPYSFRIPVFETEHAHEAKTSFELEDQKITRGKFLWHNQQVSTWKS